MNQDHPSTRRVLLALGAGLLALAAALAIDWLLYQLMLNLGSAPLEMALQYILLPLMTLLPGAALGLGSWLLLRRWIIRRRWAWMAASAGGLVFGGIAWVMLFSAVFKPPLNHLYPMLAEFAAPLTTAMRRTGVAAGLLSSLPVGALYGLISGGMLRGGRRRWWLASLLLWAVLGLAGALLLVDVMEVFMQYYFLR